MIEWLTQPSCLPTWWTFITSIALGAWGGCVGARLLLYALTERE